MYNMSIPGISKEELRRRYKLIKPIVEFNGEKHFLRQFTTEELSSISYIFFQEEDIRKEVPSDFYRVYGEDIECIHKYGFSSWFKPSIAEVLAQITEKDTLVVKAFEIMEYPEKEEDFAKNPIHLANGFHVSKVRLYY